MKKNNGVQRIQQLLQKLQDPKKKYNTNKIQGQIVQILRSVSYFRNQAQIYGADVLKYYVGIIQPYVLRAGMQIIDIWNEYVVMEGRVEGKRQDGSLGNIYSNGLLIDPQLQQQKAQSQRQLFIGSHEVDTQLIKIAKDGEKRSTLIKYQKQQIVHCRHIQKIINSDRSLLQYKNKLCKLDFFQRVGNHDINQLVIHSKIVVANKGSGIYRVGKKVKQICCIISGLIKIYYSLANVQDSEMSNNYHLDSFKEETQFRSSSMSNFVGGGDWIGIDQCFNQKSHYLNKTEVVSQQCQYLSIDMQFFKQKFNEVTYFLLTHELKKLNETKKQILVRSLKIRKQHDKNEIKKGERRRQRFASKQKKQQQQLHKSQRKKKKKSLTPQKKIFFPDMLIHHIKISYRKGSMSESKSKQNDIIFPKINYNNLLPQKLKSDIKKLNEKRYANQKVLQKSFQVLLHQKNNPQLLLQLPKNKNTLNPPHHQSHHVNNARFSSIDSLKQSSLESKRLRKQSHQLQSISKQDAQKYHTDRNKKIDKLYGQNFFSKIRNTIEFG